MPIQHGDQIIELISAMMHPKQLAIIKCQAHKKARDFVMKGNNAADQYANKPLAVQQHNNGSLSSDSTLNLNWQTLREYNNKPHHMKLVCGSTEEQHEMQWTWRSHEGHMIAPNTIAYQS